MPRLIRSETPLDHDSIREVNQQAFGRIDEAELVEALRSGGYSRVSMVAEEDGQVVGHILFSELTILGESLPVKSLALAPLAVLPSFQGRGIGSMLVKAGLEACRERGDELVVVLGHPEYYPKFGFSAKQAERLRSPFSGPAFMALELGPAPLERHEGVVKYPPPFGLS